MKTKIISSILFLLLIATPAKAQDWEFVGLDSMVIKQLYVSGDSIWAGTAVRSGANINSGLYFTSNGGNNWIQLDSAFGSGISVGMEYIVDGELYLIKGLSEGSLAGKVYKTTNNGFSWDTISISNNGIRWLGTSPFNKNEIYTLDRLPYPAGLINTLFKSTDGGENWETLGPFPSSSHGSALTFAIDLIDSMSLYVTVDTQFDQYFYKSSNKGESWNYVSEPPITPAETKTDLFLPDRIYLFVYYKASDDGGLSWYDAYTGLPNNTDYLSFYIVKKHPGLLFNLRRDGLYVTENDTISWELIEGTDELPLDLGIEGYRFDDVGTLKNVFINENRNLLYIGTALGIYKREFVTSINEGRNKTNVLEYHIHPNYPNPFNSSTKIRFSIPENEFINLSVYNLLGEKVAELVNETKTAGEYEVSFNATNLFSGIYLAKISAGKFNQAVKMLYLK